MRNYIGMYSKMGPKFVLALGVWCVDHKYSTYLERCSHQNVTPIKQPQFTFMMKLFDKQQWSDYQAADYQAGYKNTVPW